MTTVPGSDYPLRVLVCGGRDYNDAATLRATLDAIRVEEIAHGAARGADTLASLWAASKGIKVQRYPADWRTYGRVAGPIRNKQMLDDFRPDLVVAFPGGRGTADMVRRAEAAGVEVLRVGEPE